MQIKKFEAPTIQEALDTIKRELGPEAIILQTKKHRRGFGLMSKSSVEVTAAVSERSLQKKKFVEERMPPSARTQIDRLSAEDQARIYSRYEETDQTARIAQSGATASQSKPKQSTLSKLAEKAAVGFSQRGKQIASDDQKAGSGSRITATRYIDIDPDEIPAPTPSSPKPASTLSRPARPAGASSVAAPMAKAAYAAQSEASSPQQNQQQTQQQTQTRAATQAFSGTDTTARVGKRSVDEELEYLKQMLEEIKIGQDHSMGSTSARALQNQGGLSSPALHDAFEQLLMSGIDRRYAFALLRSVAFELGPEKSNSPEAVLDQIAEELMKTVEILAPLETLKPRAKAAEGKPYVLALVGPTGVGKTTTVAKIASEAMSKKNLRVGLINLDYYKIAAPDQLATYSKLLNVPFRNVISAEELKSALADFQSLDLIIIDTTGRSQRDPESLQDLQRILNSAPGIHTQLVVTATTRDNELYDISKRFSMFRPQGLVVSKLDEASLYGSIYNVSQRAKLPLIYFTTGQRVPEDLEEATKERVAALIMDI